MSDPLDLSDTDAQPAASSLAARVHAAAHLRGDFVLRSGASSDEYFDKYRFEAEPALLRDIGQEMLGLLPVGAEAVAGLELGGIPLATMLSQLTGLPSRFVRKEAKPYGTRELAEGGGVAGLPVVVVEDVVTSGGQVIASCRDLHQRGAAILAVVCVIDRQAGGTEALAAEGLELRALFTADELREAAGDL